MRTIKFIKTVLTAWTFLWALSACGGAGEIAASAASQDADGQSAAPDDGVAAAAETDDSLFTPPTLVFDFSGAAAVLVQDESSVGALVDSGDGAAFLTLDELDSNAWILDENGGIRPIATAENAEGRSITVERIDVAPTGEIYFLFEHSVIVNGERCKWVVAGLDGAICADTETRFDFVQIRFDGAGDAYFSGEDGRIKTRDRETGVVATLWDGEGIGFTLKGFIAAPDGGLMIAGELEGTSQGFFRLTPAAEGRPASLEEQCVESVKASVKGGAPGDEMYLSAAGELYVRSTRGVCGELAEADLYKASFGPDGVRYEPLAGFYADFFAEDSQGGVYAVDDGEGMLVRVDDGSFDLVTMPFADIELFEVAGDNVLATGRDASGRRAFVRKSLIDGSETDLLEGADLLVQSFDAAENGDVYFAALDYATAARKLFRYDAASASLEPVESLASGLKQIVFVGDLTGGLPMPADADGEDGAEF